MYHFVKSICVPESRAAFDAASLLIEKARSKTRPSFAGVILDYATPVLVHKCT